MKKYRIGVIGDIHANLTALDAAIEVLDKSECNEFIFLGDLLTYGIDILDVIERITNICQRKKTILLCGNHDKIYLSASKAEFISYVENLPSWIRDSISYTKNILSPKIFDALPFVDSYKFRGIYFAHANPYGKGDWRYINTDADHANASKILQKLEMSCGVFGHTHRPKYYLDGKVTEVVSSDVFRFNILHQKYPCVVNAGSIGQPRGKTGSYVLLMDVQDDWITINFKKINFEISSQIIKLKQCSLSNETIGKLTSFFI